MSLSCRSMAMMWMLMLLVLMACIICSFAHKNVKMRRDGVASLCVTATALVVGIEKRIEKSRPQGMV